MYIYPDNLSAKATLWLWELRDIGIIGVGLLLSVLALTQTGIALPLVLTAVFAFLTIRHEGTSILDFIRYAAAFLITKQQYTPIAVDNFVNSSAESLRRVGEITGQNVTLIEGDIRDEYLLNEIFGSCEIACVIHFAGLKAVGESVMKPLDYYQNNLDATLELCSAMSRHKVKRIIFSSSATVYSGDNEMPLRETSKTGNCTNPYGWTKFMCEQILRDMAKADPEWSVVNLRYFNPVGAHESGKIGEHPNGIPNNLMPYISQTAIGKRDHLNVFGNDYPTPDGTGVRDYIHVVDLAKGHVAAIQYLMQHNGESVFNLGTGHGYSVLDMVHAREDQ